MSTKILNAVIPNGEAESNVIGLGENVIVGIIMPPEKSWTPAVLTFIRMLDDEIGNNMVDKSGDEISYTGAAGQYIAVDPLLWLGVSSVIVRSGTSDDPVEQGDDRTLKLVIQELDE